MSPSRQERRPRRRPTGKSYEQQCGLALALDRIGDRWTLLILRELLYLGPRRFTDLRLALPGMASNLLASRLRTLVAGGLVRARTLPPPAASQIYEATDLGQGLEPALFALLRWGQQFASPDPDPSTLRPELPLMALRASFRGADAAGVRETYHVIIDDRVFELRIDDGSLTIHEGAEQPAAFTLQSDLRTFADVVMQRCRAKDAVRRGAWRLSGTANAAENFVRIFAQDPELRALGKRPRR